MVFVRVYVCVCVVACFCWALAPEPRGAPATVCLPCQLLPLVYVAAAALGRVAPLAGRWGLYGRSVTGEGGGDQTRARAVWRGKKCFVTPVEPGRCRFACSCSCGQGRFVEPEPTNTKLVKIGGLKGFYFPQSSHEPVRRARQRGISTHRKVFDQKKISCHQILNVAFYDPRKQHSDFGDN